MLWHAEIRLELIADIERTAGPELTKMWNLIKTNRII
jgi:hypothetical protein